MIGKKYTYNPLLRVWGLWQPLVASFVPCVLITALLGWLGSQGDLFVATVSLATVAALLVFFGYVGYVLMSLSAYPHIIVRENGLTVEYLFFWRVFIPWKDITDISETASFFRRWIPRGVTLRDGKIVHRIIGIFYGFGFAFAFEPVFMISPFIKDFDELVALIEQKVAENKANR